MTFLAIPVRPGHKDFIAWHYDVKGVFSVKSTYHIMEDSRELSTVRQQGESSGSAAVNYEPFSWKKI